MNNLCATIDINRLGQSEPTMLQYDLKTYQARWEAFGWQAVPVDGHDPVALMAAYELARETRDRPSVVLARTLKGKGLGEIENAEHWHGKALDREMPAKVVAELKSHLTGSDVDWQPNLPVTAKAASAAAKPGAPPDPPYQIGGKEIATRRG